MATPKWLEYARKEIGTKEFPGAASNKRVGQYYADATGHTQTDSVPWCAAFVGSMLKRSGVKGSGSLMAKSYLRWGKAISKPYVGCVVVFSRGGIKAPTGHVAFVNRVGVGSIDVLGGNQSDQVNVVKRRTRDALGFRWPSTKALPSDGKKKGVPMDEGDEAYETYDCPVCEGDGKLPVIKSAKSKTKRRSSSK